MEKYIDSTITIDETTLPKIVLEYIKKLKFYASEDDGTMYIITFENFDATIKSFVLNHRISEEDYISLIKKYGGLY